jgi:hypothetical protein
MGVCRTPCRSAASPPPSQRLDSTPMSLRRDWLLQRLVRQHRRCLLEAMALRHRCQPEVPSIVASRGEPCRNNRMRDSRDREGHHRHTTTFHHGTRTRRHSQTCNSPAGRRSLEEDRRNRLPALDPRCTRPHAKSHHSRWLPQPTTPNREDDSWFVSSCRPLPP